MKQKIPKSLRSKLCKIKFMAFDADGVLFVNDAFHGLVIEGKSLKPVTRSHYDGQGITFLRSLGIRVCIITGSYGVDAEAKTELAERWNGLPSAKVGKLTPVEVFTDRDGPLKLVTLNAWLAKHQGSLAECAAMGNDVGDSWMLEAVSVAFAPSCAVESIKALATYVTKREGGRGAVREVADLILEARGINPRSLPLK